MSLLSRVSQVLGVGAVFGSQQSTFRAMQQGLALVAQQPVNYRERYGVLRAYYANNGLYEFLSRALYESGLWTPAMTGLRNPAYRIVEAHAAHLWPGDLPDALPIDTDNEQIKEPIAQIWTWSNWAARKQTFARWLAMLGDVFVKVASRQDATGTVTRVYFELVDPAQVWDFDTDDRGFLTWIRIDMPQTRRLNDQMTSFTHVEIWDKLAGTYRRWEIPASRHDDLADLRRLGPPLETRTLESMGLPGFIPVVHCKFLDVGEDRGIGAYLLQLDKIDALNQNATRLAQMLFRHGKPTMVVHGAGNDPTGRPLPGPRLEGSTANTQGAPGWTPVSDADIWYLPGTAQVDALVPNIPYSPHRDQLIDLLADLEHDRPELAVARVQELLAADQSGRALRLALGPFVSLEQEIRGNAEDCLARLDQIALTIGQNLGLFPALGGTYDSGAFDHTFKCRPIIPDSPYEQAQTAQFQANAIAQQLASGAFSIAGALRLTYNLDDTEIAQMQQEQQAEEQAQLAAAPPPPATPPAVSPAPAASRAQQLSGAAPQLAGLVSAPPTRP